MIQTQGKHGEIISSFNKHLLCVGVFKGYMQYRKLLNVLCLYRDRDSCKFLVFSSVFIFAPRLLNLVRVNPYFKWWVFYRVVLASNVSSFR